MPIPLYLEEYDEDMEGDLWAAPDGQTYLMTRSHGLVRLTEEEKKMMTDGFGAAVIDRYNQTERS